MTAKEIREQVSPMVIWMADATIKEARRALCGNTFWHDVNRADYNLPEVEMASKVLFNMIRTCEEDIRIALINMPKELNGDGISKRLNYFDEFIETLGMLVEVKLRETSWILDRC